MASLSDQSAPALYSRVSVRKNDLRVAPVTQWRWEQAGVIPLPDIEIRGRKYYSAQKRNELLAAVLGSKEAA